ncbi:hypothetical protein BHE74_00052454 [Ensete ventricosum]|nr:hypothetical protein GW17_00053626 [Ensete ventricosum]RWW42022.1 hypothetical protein BHE74_00052454 [Ensete ventricosum]
MGGGGGGGTFVSSLRPLPLAPYSFTLNVPELFGFPPLTLVLAPSTVATPWQMMQRQSKTSFIPLCVRSQITLLLDSFHRRWEVGFIAVLRPRACGVA